ncbi:MAG: ABC transporter permease subunit [Clostridia bacterium]|nr:ABC transporter permease subunit [Clostridia bacterium]
MKDKLIAICRAVLTIIFWLLVWQIAALIVDKEFFLPTIGQTMKELWSIFRKKAFPIALLTTLLRVICGITVGTALGIILATLSHYSLIAKSIISPFISVVKSTPVATFIIILWIFLSGNSLPIFIAVLMVMPIIWQNVLDGFGAVNRELAEVCKLYRFSFKKRVKVLIFPTVLNYFIPAFITSASLAWKAEIAAEIIAYTKNSIGGSISDANSIYKTAEVFAWTLIVITFSILIEALTKFLTRRFKSNA